MTTFIERWKRERVLILTHIMNSLKVAIFMKFVFINDQRNNPFLSCKMDMYKYYNYDKG